jgi:hypothetical protein
MSEYASKGVVVASLHILEFLDIQDHVSYNLPHKKELLISNYNELREGIK